MRHWGLQYWFWGWFWGQTPISLKRARKAIAREKNGSRETRGLTPG
jgi:hypothetical protein